MAAVERRGAKIMLVSKHPPRNYASGSAFGIGEVALTFTSHCISSEICFRCLHSAKRWSVSSAHDGKIMERSKIANNAQRCAKRRRHVLWREIKYTPSLFPACPRHSAVGSSRGWKMAAIACSVHFRCPHAKKTATCGMNAAPNRT